MFSFGVFFPFRISWWWYIYIAVTEKSLQYPAPCTRQCANIAVPALKILQHQKVCFIEEKAIVHLKKNFLF